MLQAYLSAFAQPPTGKLSIVKKNYAVALRNACLYHEYSTIHFLLDHIPGLELNGQSNGGNTALDWLAQQGLEKEETSAAKSRLISLGALTKDQISMKIDTKNS